MIVKRSISGLEAGGGGAMFLAYRRLFQLGLGLRVKLTVLD